ncbi:imidazole glycerol phosphate synthase subunit HisF [Candidatus Tenderia electrophaga]|jgi:cyclase|uniref:imidazole glycerol-phosphate synthase n=1 Tax=Candidatus Tenderia electrophaga TaxID=1748243 RepID=A0A0S2TBV8_9GAMM|nr:imidazole glycerol phosphate synthase subunit HisF [Candidatus Tenderia electrophaga]
MPHSRLIARLDIKAPNLIKGVHLEGLRKLGDPNEFARRYYQSGVDELLYMDIVASLYERNNLTEVIQYTAQNIFIPFTVGGGVRSVEDVAAILRAGADKVAMNTAAVRRPALISEAARRFGSQCVVLSIEAKQRGQGAGWEAYTDNGREHTGLDVIDWAKQAATLGAGEILLTSVDQEGTRKGMDTDLIAAVSEAVSIPVIASGGVGDPEHVGQALQLGADAVAVADALHYDRFSVHALHKAMRAAGSSVRHIPDPGELPEVCR